MVHDLQDFKANWRKFCDHSYFRDLHVTSNQINKTNDLILNLTPENVTQHSRIE